MKNRLFFKIQTIVIFIMAIVYKAFLYNPIDKISVGFSIALTIIASLSIGVVAFEIVRQNKDSIIKRESITIFLKREKDGSNFAYIMNTKTRKPLCCVLVNEKNEDKFYTIAFSNKEDYIYGLDPDTGVGQRILGYKSNEDV